MEAFATDVAGNRGVPRHLTSPVAATDASIGNAAGHSQEDSQIRVTVGTVADLVAHETHAPTRRRLAHFTIRAPSESP